MTKEELRLRHTSPDVSYKKVMQRKFQELQPVSLMDLGVI